MDIYKVLEEIWEQQFPRIMTQVCRDPSSSDFGCFDRNHWHYMIRDFPSILLQQGSAILAHHADASEESHPQLRDLAKGGAIFWNKRAQRRGAFEEYYPYEQGYPPLAFSTWGMVQLLDLGVVNKSDLLTGFSVASAQLQSRFESKAANQQLVGLAALEGMLKHQLPQVEENPIKKIREKVMTLQNQEGWFEEYGGPDLGYLSVGIDALWDCYDYTNDKDVYLEMIRKSLEFMEASLLFNHDGLGMHNSRNTDYIVPYGICRGCIENVDPRITSSSRNIISVLTPNLGTYLSAVDDRYWCHYVGLSTIRALRLMRLHSSGYQTPEAPLMESLTFEQCGWFGRSFGTRKVQVSAKKGGILTVLRTGESLLEYDFGWQVERNGILYVQHWWSDDWVIECCNEKINVEGHLVSHKQLHAGPFKHAILRLLSFFLGKAIIKILKDIFIFKALRKKPSSEIPYVRRTIEFFHNQVQVIDELSGLKEQDIITKSRRSSKRHVASADSFHLQDLMLPMPSSLEEKTEKNRRYLSKIEM